MFDDVIGHFGFRLGQSTRKKMAVVPRARQAKKRLVRYVLKGQSHEFEFHLKFRWQAIFRALFWNSDFPAITFLYFSAAFYCFLKFISYFVVFIFIAIIIVFNIIIIVMRKSN